MTLRPQRRFFPGMPALAVACALLVAACGGDAGAPAVVTAASVRADTVADYRPLAQQIHVAYYGRPASPAALDALAGALLAAAAPLDLRAAVDAYGVNAGLREVFDKAAVSEESAALYPRDAAGRIDAAYALLFGHAPDAAGRQSWLDALGRGALARDALPAAILAYAGGADATLAQRRVEAAAALTAAIDTDAEKAALESPEGRAAARTLLAGVTAATDMPALLAGADAALQSLLGPFPRVRAILAQRCVVCHSANPVFPGISRAPLGIQFDTEAQIRADAKRIYTNVVVTRFMPYGNRTAMTEEERAFIKTWYEGGAK